LQSWLTRLKIEDEEKEVVLMGLVVLTARREKGIEKEEDKEKLWGYMGSTR